MNRLICNVQTKVNIKDALSLGQFFSLVLKLDSDLYLILKGGLAVLILSSLCVWPRSALTKGLLAHSFPVHLTVKDETDKQIENVAVFICRPADPFTLVSNLYSGVNTGQFQFRVRFGERLKIFKAGYESLIYPIVSLDEDLVITLRRLAHPLISDISGKLDRSGENIKEAAKKALDEGKVHYASNYGIPELREAIVQKMERENNISYDPASEVVVTVGANEGVLLAMMGLLNPGDEVLIPDPVWLHYFYCAQMAGAVPVSVPTKEKNGFVPHIDDFKALLTPKTKMIVLTSPNNPTGAVADLESLEALVRLAKEEDLFVISDEIYESMVYDGNRHISIAGLPGMRERTVIVNGFSKRYSMTGWRLGWIVADKALVSAMIRIHQYTTVCVTTFAQYCAYEALTGPQEEIGNMIAESIDAEFWFSYVVGWMIAHCEQAALAKRLIKDSCAKQEIEPEQLTLHADRGSSMKSKVVAHLLSDLGITKTHSRPHVSDENPYSEAQFKTLKYCPQFPDRFGSIQDARSFCQSFFSWYNKEHNHTGIALMTPEQVHYGLDKQIYQHRSEVLANAFEKYPNRFKGKMLVPESPPVAAWINKPSTDNIDSNLLTGVSHFH